MASVWLGVLACDGGVPGGRTVSDAGQDFPTDAPGPDRAPGVACPPVSSGEQRGLGACCSAAADCAGGVCWNGFCTKTCSAATDCGPVVAPSPLPVGTPMACASNKLGDPFSYCLPGSLSDCTTVGAACPAGEGCALGLSATATTATAAMAYQGICLTRLRANEYQPAGEACAAESGPYACEDQGGYLGSGCVARRCTRACATSSVCPIGMQCRLAPYSAKLGGGVSYQTPATPGICLGRVCGAVHGQAGLAVGEATEQGADSLCVTGDVCAPTMAVGATGDTQLLSCVPPRDGALGFGQACSSERASTTRCADDSLCIERGGQKFCSKLCRVDLDCPSGAHCIEEYPGPPLPNGSMARLAMCTPRALITGTTCQVESDCGAAEACLPAGARTALLVCRATSGTKSVGAACASAAECRSGECVDRDLNVPTGANRTFCGGFCRRNSDCSAAQLCLRVVRNNNQTVEDMRDDVRFGYCTPLTAPAVAGGCVTNDNCTGAITIDETGGDTCDPVHRTCYRKAARIGDACQSRAACPLGAYCRLNDPRFPGGVCLSQGCDPAASTGVDACPTGAVCVQRPTADSPLSVCYEACGAGMLCNRAAEGYRCDMPVPGQTVSICMGQGGP